MWQYIFMLIDILLPDIYFIMLQESFTAYEDMPLFLLLNMKKQAPNKCKKIKLQLSIKSYKKCLSLSWPNKNISAFCKSLSMTAIQCYTATISFLFFKSKNLSVCLI